MSVSFLPMLIRCIMTFDKLYIFLSNIISKLFFGYAWNINVGVSNYFHNWRRIFCLFSTPQENGGHFEKIWILLQVTHTANLYQIKYRFQVFIWDKEIQTPQIRSCHLKIAIATDSVPTHMQLQSWQIRNHILPSLK